MNVMIPDSDAVYMAAPKVLARYGISDMTLWRWLRDEKLNFPRPIRIGRIRYFSIAELDAFDAAQREATPERRAAA
jgi:predicted DNA-binding transcriptional regulator AlpA